MNHGFPDCIISTDNADFLLEYGWKVVFGNRMGSHNICQIFSIAICINSSTKHTRIHTATYCAKNVDEKSSTITGMPAAIGAPRSRMDPIGLSTCGLTTRPMRNQVHKYMQFDVDSFDYTR